MGFNKLKLAEWASIAEIVGGIAIVISLLYVGYEIDRNTSEVRAANRQHLVNRAHTATMQYATNPELAGVMTKVSEGAKLSDKERTQHAYAVRGVLYDVQEAFLLNREAMLDDDYWMTRQALVLLYLQPPPARAIYEKDKALGLLHKEYVKWLDGTLTPRSKS